ncbi:ATP-dependent helicase [Patescibacteria group bacterium]
MDIRDNLNQEQKKAVEHKDGPLLIIAGAGTGKTTVIAQRIAWLIEQKLAEPNEILALTFTEKAAEEMEERVDRLLPYGYVDLWVSTFHSFGERILRDHAIAIGLDANFKVLPTVDQWLVLRDNIDSLQLKYYKPLGNPTSFLRALVSHFSRLKDENISPAAYLAYAKKLSPKKDEETERVLEAAQAYEKYEQLLRAGGHLDFGDLIMQTLRLFKERNNVLKSYQQQFKYILVDEFQDTNMAQYDLVKLLADPKNNLTVCGDDDQSIYKFRGAAVSNILEFKNDYPKSKEVVLTENYRSTQPILDLAHNFIQLNNPNRLEARLKTANKMDGLQTTIDKKLHSQMTEKGTIELISAPTADDEMKQVLAKIIELKEKKNVTWDQFAILVRANSQADDYIKQLTNQNIPYQFVAARGLFQRPEILDLISYLKLLDNYHESAAVYRVLTMPVFGVPMKEVVALNQLAKRRSISLYEALHIDNQLQITRSAQAITKLIGLVEEQTELVRTKSAGHILYQFLTKTNLIDTLRKQKKDNEILNISKFVKYAYTFEQNNQDASVQNFVRELSLLIEMGEDPAPAAVEQGPEAVKIMTVHGAKGLEFDHVFLPQLVDRRFPSTERKEQIAVPDDLVREILLEGDMHLEEERRLMYVAITRARSSLYLSWARDMGGVRAKKPSRFLHELGLVAEEETKKKQKPLELEFQPPAEITDKKPVLPLPTRYSFTQLKSFETCPKQYHYAHILKIPTDGNANFSFGRTVHNTMNDFYQKVTATKKPSLKALLDLYDRHWISEWYDSKQHEAERKAAGKEALETFYEANKTSLKKPKLLEKGFTIKIGGYSLRGVIDRVDDLGKGEVEIIDYKTGKVPKTDKQVDTDQLLIYAIAAREVFEDNPVKVTFNYLEGNVQKSFSFDEAEFTAMKDKILTMIEAIQKSDFKATPSKFVCGRCDFREICEDRVV